MGPFKLFLYGSRVNPALKGGDIDLLLLVPPADLDEVTRRKYQLLAGMKFGMGDQRIDLLVKALDDEDTFVSEILQSALLLEERG